MYSKNQSIKNVNQLNVLINVQQLHDESIKKTISFFRILKNSSFLLEGFYMNQVFSNI